MRTARPLIAAAIVLLAISVFRGDAGAIAPQAPDPADVAEGMRLYLHKGDCQTCHGWAADGRKMDSQMPDSPSLRETRLRRAKLPPTGKRGRPGTRAPTL